MNTYKIIFVLLFTCLLIQNNTYSSTYPLIRYDSTYLKKLYAKGEKAYLKKNYTDAKKRLIKFISIPSPANDTTWWDNPGYRYMMMKNKSCEYLKNICFEEKDFRNALYYFNLSKGIYKLNIARCGNYWEESADAMFVSQCYEGLQELDSALLTVVSHIGWPSSVLNKRFVELALKKVGSDSLKSEMEKALDVILFIEDCFAIKLLGFNVNISFFGPTVVKRLGDSTKIENYVVVEVLPEIVIPRTEEEIAEEKIKVKENFKQSDLYKLIMEN